MPQDILERTLDGHKITRLNAGHYLCKSRSRPGISFAVDIEAHNGLGHCECEDFLYRRLPRWKKVKASYAHFRCKHLRAVRDHVLDQIIAWRRKRNKEEGTDNE